MAGHAIVGARPRFFSALLPFGNVAGTRTAAQPDRGTLLASSGTCASVAPWMAPTPGTIRARGMPAQLRAVARSRRPPAAAVRRREQAFLRRRRGRSACRSTFSPANSSRCSALPAAARPRCCACSPASRRRTKGAFCSTAQDIAPVPPHRRPVNMMFQSYALFPHLTVEGNVAFGLKQEGLPKSGDRGARRRHAGAGQARRLRQTQAAPAFRRPAPARRARPLAGEASARAPARRAARGARQEAARGDAVRADASAGEARASPSSSSPTTSRRR